MRSNPMSTLRKTLSIAALLSLMCLNTPSKASDLGMTPSHVFGLWTSINAVLIKLADVDTSDQNLPSKMTDLRAQSVDNKKPADVLEKVGNFRENINELLRHGGIAPIEQHENASVGDITPSDVYLNSGNILDGLVYLLLSKTDSSTLISHYFNANKFTGKTPNDVYALVQLSNQRLALLTQ